ncbi:MAG: hypothetical protein ACE5JF_10590 [Anaerolineales bacterium]
MAKSDGISLTSRLSKLYRTSAFAETLFLIGIGILAVTLHAYLRLPLKVPGHKGLIWIGLLMIGRLASQRRWAATTTSTSAAVTTLLPIMGFKDPLDTAVFLISGIVVDLGFLLSPRFVVSFWGVALLGALSHATKPVAKSLASAGSGLSYPSLMTGVAYPLLLHALFGAVGAILAVISIRLIRRSD